MIKKLFIKDFAIIKELEIPLKNGLTVITGETGAGKSILLKALGFALGAKSDKTYVRSGQEQSVVEVEVQTNKDSIYRRLLSKGGRSRSFVNDEPTIDINYKSLVKVIADFHGQNEQQYILNSNTHIDFLDSYCKSEELVKKIEFIFSNLSKTIDLLNKAKIQQETASNQKELLKFQLNEINSISPQENEDVKLGVEFKRLNHIDELISTVQNMNQSLTEHDHSIYRQLISTLNDLERLSNYDKNLGTFIDSLKQASISIQDASVSLFQYAENIDNDPEQSKIIEDRLQEIESLKRKYGGSIESIFTFKSQAEVELESLSGLDQKIIDLEEERYLLVTQYQKIADQLHESRINNAIKLSKEIELEMSELNMAGSTFEILINTKPNSESLINFNQERIAFGSKGYDTIEFFLSANPGELPKPLVKVASGGEVSRIMLAIKSVLKKSDPVETLIFDEIDSGISGQAAEKVALSLEALAKNKQVLCITHLPQIASRAHHHMHISKKINNNQTDVVLNYLKEEEKLEAIAGLFSGENISVESISTVKEFREKARG
ncbi:MAG: DNA repair protein RecN [Candidatus Marinimicrobia bacterium]|nr:DNA repair protein RecN [Candidatus Neomarinimicrobiota bacterium]MBT7524621.1 DNA repair protein RecN [Candidatus Neomarinimicrobiota bacterium]